MSLINDALKQARKVSPQDVPSSPPPLQPMASVPPTTTIWLLPAFVIVLLVAAVFFIGWSVAPRSTNPTVPAPKPVAAAQPVEVAIVPVSTPVIALPPPTASPAPLPVAAPALPKLQGIFYSPTAASAIVAGKTVRTGDQFMDYRVQEISKNAVTLAAADGKIIRLTLGN